MGWLLLCASASSFLCAACDDEKVCVGGNDSADCADAGGDGDGDGDGDADRYASFAAAVEADRVAAGLPGLVAGVVEGGELVWAQGFGFKDRDSADPVTPDTLFRVLETHWAAMALLQLVDQGQVDLDAPVIDYVPLANDVHPDYVPQVTIRHLLTHTAGLRSAWGGTLVEDWPVDGDAALDDWLTSPEFASTPIFGAPPGAVFLDSGLGAAIMAWVVQTVSGEMFADYMRAHVLDPLGMTRTTFRWEEAVADGDFAYGVDSRARYEPDEPEQPGWYRANTAWTSVNDLAKLAGFFLEGDEAVLSQELLDEAMSPQVDARPSGGFHFGFFGIVSDTICAPLGGACPTQHQLREHVAWGRTAGYDSYMSLVPERDFALVYLGHDRGRNVVQSELLAFTEFLGLAPLVEDHPGDDHDPSVYVGQYLLDTGIGTTRITIRDDGSLHLSSPLCTLEPVSSAFFECSRSGDVTFWFDDEGAVQYMVTYGWTATPIPEEGGDQ